MRTNYVKIKKTQIASFEDENSLIRDYNRLVERYNELLNEFNLSIKKHNKFKEDSKIFILNIKSKERELKDLLNDKFNSVKSLTFSNDVKKIFNNKCDICDSSDVLETHHLFSKKLYPYLAFNLDNGVCLCSKCHKNFHREYDDVKKITPFNYTKFKIKYILDKKNMLSLEEYDLEKHYKKVIYDLENTHKKVIKDLKQNNASEINKIKQKIKQKQET